MIVNQDNEYTALLDACVLVPMCLCDTLLRLAKDPAMYRPIWSNRILQEVGDTLESRIGLSRQQRDHRITQMSEAFPEASIPVPSCLSDPLDGVPDPNDKHVLAAAITGHAHVIVTSNINDFPDSYLAQFDILCHSPDDFLIHQFHLNPYQILEKLNAQAVNIRRQRGEILSTLKLVAPNFVALVETFL
ncbi:MAG TPA: PIN domain-containing protein [Terriglobales bacterium]|nr:PIN domain-containing protein [Terriglobales bacterium]